MGEHKKKSDQIQGTMQSTKNNNEIEEQDFVTYQNEENSQSELTSPFINNKFQNSI